MDEREWNVHGAKVEVITPGRHGHTAIRVSRGRFSEVISVGDYWRSNDLRDRKRGRIRIHRIGATHALVYSTGSMRFTRIRLDRFLGNAKAGYYRAEVVV